MTLKTPCIRVCEMDSAHGICAGCGRTLDEIARWGSMTDGERAAIMAALGGRLALLNKDRAAAERMRNGGV